MGAEDGEVYMLRPDEDEGDDDETWVTPQPASEVIIEAVAEATDDDPDEFDDLEEYVDVDELAALFDAEEDSDDSLTFEVEDHEVTVDESGDVTVED